MKGQCDIGSCGDICGIDSSLLFFFLILVCLFNQYDCGVGMDTLLLFFLLLVTLTQNFG